MPGPHSTVAWPAGAKANIARAPVEQFRVLLLDRNEAKLGEAAEKLKADTAQALANYEQALTEARNKANAIVVTGGPGTVGPRRSRALQKLREELGDRS